MDEELVEEFITEKQSQIENVNTDVDMVHEALEQLWKIMSLENNGTTSRLVGFFRFCAGVTSTFLTNDGEEYLHPWLKITKVEECDQALEDFKNYTNITIVMKYKHIQRDHGFFIVAEEFKYIYTAEQSDDENFSGQLHQEECFDLINKGEGVIDSFLDVMTLINEMINGDLGES